MGVKVRNWFAGLATMVMLAPSSAAAQSAHLACLTQDLTGSDSSRAAFISVLGETSQVFGIAPEILVAIKLTESGRSLSTSVTNHNRNNTVDRGLFQVNAEVWLPEMRRIGLEVGNPDLHDMRTNALVAGWVLRRKMNRFPGDVYQAVGHYHKGGGVDASSERIRETYMRSFMPHLRRVVSRCYNA